jgi:hypothetical protein
MVPGGYWGGRIDSELTMNSQCTHWVNAPSPPVLTDTITIILLNKYVTGKASVFYMKYVAGNAKKWTLKKIFEGLFEYCFPKDFITDLRRKPMTASQGKTRVTEFIRDIELMADRFRDVNGRMKTDIFWTGLHPPIRSRVLEMGGHPERSTIEKLVKLATRAEDGILDAAAQRNRERDGRTWGRFANRTTGPKPYQPVREDEKSERAEGRDRVRANAVTPNPRPGPTRPNGQRPKPTRRGKKISREKRDQLRAEGKCFQCERTGHSQRDCPEFNTMKPPTVRMNHIELARLERTSKVKDKADLRVGCASFFSSDDDATISMWRAYQMCASRWGADDRWLDFKTRWESKYSIYQYETGHGDIIEVIVEGMKGLGTLEFQ